jgi:hypothetical protein
VWGNDQCHGQLAAIDAILIGWDPNGYVPTEAIRGYWLIGPDGKLTGEFAENPRHGMPTDSFSKLTELDHFWDWLPDEPAIAIRESGANLLGEQTEGATLEWMKVTDTPEMATA